MLFYIDWMNDQKSLCNQICICLSATELCEIPGVWYNDIGSKVELNHGGRGILKGKCLYASLIKV